MNSHKTKHLVKKELDSRLELTIWIYTYLFASEDLSVALVDAYPIDLENKDGITMYTKLVFPNWFEFFYYPLLHPVMLVSLRFSVHSF